MLKKPLIALLFGSIILGGCMQGNNQTPVNQGVNQTPTIAQEPTSAPTLEPTMPSASVSGKTTKQTSNTVIIKTSKGDIVLKLYLETAPQTVKNFLTKAQNGYYKGLTFHRVVPGFVIQGGDPKGDGTGGGDIPTELSSVPFKAGSLGVARANDIKVSNDSQFFICIETESCAQLTGQYTNFGEVVTGMDVVKAIAVGDKIDSITLK